jgi:tetratricopeptide (TPR) repeat protein
MAQRGWEALRVNHPEEARDCFAAAVRLNPRKSAYRAALADVDWTLNDLPGAIFHFERALSLNPSETAVRSRLVQLYWSLHRDLDVLRILHVPDPEEPLRSAWRFSRALSLFRLGRLSAAQLEFKALQTHPDFQAPVNFFLGRIAYAQNDFEQALPYLAKAVRLGDTAENRDFNAYRYDYGLALFRLGRYSEANEQFRATTEHYDQDPIPWLMRGRCEQELGHHEEAIKAYERSIQIDPTFQLSYYHLARLEQRYGDPQRADELFKRLGDLKESEIRAKDEQLLNLESGPSRNFAPKPRTH